MKHSGARPRTPSPAAAVIALVALMTLLLGGAGLHTTWTLRSLRTEYLENRAQEIARDILRSVRGPARFGSSELWRDVFTERLAAATTGLAYLALQDGQGRELLRVEAQPGSGQGATPKDAFIWTQPVGPGRGGPPWRDPEPAAGGRALVIALDPAIAAFIDREVWAHAGVTLSAVGLLWGLAFYLIQLNRKMVALAVEQAKERHLADLGRMAAVLAHEIRNPLGAMKGLSQLALEDLPAGDPAREHLETVVREAARLEKLVQDLLLFARPRRGEAVRSDVTHLVGETISLLRTEFAAKNIELHFSSAEAPLVAETDADGLRQVILNGLRNALEASPPGSTVEVVLEGLPRERCFRLEIRDQGAGLGNQDPAELFLPFRTSKVREGSGLGLAVSKRIVEGMGGQIELANRESGGAVLRIVLPLVQTGRR
ncbi:MAG: hypothetical protein Kow00109_07440 [Acidobacteriota bacterium]